MAEKLPLSLLSVFFIDVKFINVYIICTVWPSSNWKTKIILEVVELLILVIDIDISLFITSIEGLLSDFWFELLVSFSFLRRQRDALLLVMLDLSRLFLLAQLIFFAGLQSTLFDSLTDLSWWWLVSDETMLHRLIWNFPPHLYHIWIIVFIFIFVVSYHVFFVFSDGVLELF